MSTYLRCADGDTKRAVDLYGWNARISAALLVPLHLAEVTTRNAVDDVLSRVYGAHWPWDPGFERSLPRHRPHSYNPQRDLVSARRRQVIPGKVIADLRFVFWQQMFTARHDGRLWGPHIMTVFPASTCTRPSDLRGRIWTDIESIRRLRNRIAHHEPIIARDIAADLRTLVTLVGLRSPEAAHFTGALEKVTSLLAQRP